MAIQLLPLHAGDALTSYTAAAISKIGLWDERFCNIGWQDLDYWFRVRAALATLRAYASGAAGRATVMRKYRLAGYQFRRRPHLFHAKGYATPVKGTSGPLCISVHLNTQRTLVVTVLLVSIGHIV